MSKKLNLKNITFDEKAFVIETEAEKKPEKVIKKEKDEILQAEKKQALEAEIILNRAKEQANEIILSAQKEASDLINKTKEETTLEQEKIIQEANKKAEEILSSAANDAQNLTNSTKEENENLIKASKEQIEKDRIEATNEGYKEGYTDAQGKIQEELEEKINLFNNFIKKQQEIKEKIIKSASKDILDILLNISRKVLHAELNGEILEKIIKSTILLFEKKEKITIITSEKYARLLFELQKKALSEEIEFNFEDFKQFENFEIVYNPKFEDDTLIIENLQERFDASIDAQMDVIVRDILKIRQNGKIENLEEYVESDNKVIDEPVIEDKTGESTENEP